MDPGRGGSSGRDWGWGNQGYGNSDADRWDSGRRNPGYGGGQDDGSEGRGGMSGQGYNASGRRYGQDSGQSGQYGGSGRDQWMSGSQGQGGMYGGRYSGQDGMQGGTMTYGAGMGGMSGSSRSGQGQSGSALSSEPSYRGKGPKGYQRSDDRIKEEVNEALEDEHGVDASDIEVQVQNGEVTLTGTVSDRSQKRLAEDCVERVRGVKDVHNQLRVQPQASLGETSSSGGTSGNTSSPQSKR